MRPQTRRSLGSARVCRTTGDADGWSGGRQREVLSVAHIVPCRRARRATRPAGSLFPRRPVLFELPGDPGDVTSSTRGIQPLDGAGHRHGVTEQRAAAWAWVRPRRLLLALDLAAAFLAVPFAWGWLWGADYRVRVDGAGGGLSHDIAMLLFAVVTILLLARDGQYAARRRLSRIDDGIGLVKALLVAFVVVLGLAIVTKGFGTGLHQLLAPGAAARRRGAARAHGRSPAWRCGPGSSACSGAGTGCAGCSWPAPAPRPPSSSASSPARRWLGLQGRRLRHRAARRERGGARSAACRCWRRCWAASRSCPPPCGPPAPARWSWRSTATSRRASPSSSPRCTPRPCPSA